MKSLQLKKCDRTNKKFTIMISFALILTMFFSTIPVYASENKVVDSTEYIDSLSGDLIRIEMIDEADVNMRSMISDRTLIFRLFRNEELENILYIDFPTDQLFIATPEREITQLSLSEVVTITEVEASIDSEIDNDSFADISEPMRVDYIDNEPMEVSSSGYQISLSGAPYYSGYQAMGYRGGYYYAPSVYGYLQRSNAGVCNTYNSHLFSFGAGTTIGTAAAIIVAFYTSTGGELLLSLAVAILGAIIDVITYDWSTTFEIKTFRWYYRVRLNSNTGSTIYSTYRTKDYWRGFNPGNGEVSYNYRGTTYDGGFLSSNTEMIKHAIDSYLE